MGQNKDEGFTNAEIINHTIIIRDNNNVQLCFTLNSVYSFEKYVWEQRSFITNTELNDDAKRH